MKRAKNLLEYEKRHLLTVFELAGGVVFNTGAGVETGPPSGPEGAGSKPDPLNPDYSQAWIQPPFHGSFDMSEKQCVFGKMTVTSRHEMVCVDFQIVYE